MPISTMQKPNANQVICEKCGNWTNFYNDKCPACGASLFGGEPQKNTDEPQNDSEPNEEDREDEQNPKKNEKVSEPEPPKENAKTNEQKETELSKSHTSIILRLLKGVKDWFKAVKEWIKEYYIVLVVVLGIPLIYVLYFFLLYLLDFIGYFKL